MTTLSSVGTILGLCTALFLPVTGLSAKEVSVSSVAVAGSFYGGKDISGIACLLKTCLIVSDEGLRIQTAKLMNGNLVAGKVIIPPGIDGSEGDFEAITISKNSFFTIGSHGLSKKRRSIQPNRFLIIRGNIDDLGNVSRIESSRGIWNILLKNTNFAPFTSGLKSVGPDLQSNGTNVEGLASDGEYLYVGLRAPVVSNHAWVLQVRIADVFSGNSTAPSGIVHKIYLGPGIGIREIQKSKNGFLILGGDAAPDYGSTLLRTGADYGVYFWDGKSSTTRLLMNLGSAASLRGKPEGFDIQEEGPSSFRLLIVKDGPVNGDPRIYDLTF